MNKIKNISFCGIKKRLLLLFHFKRIGFKSLVPLQKKTKKLFKKDSDLKMPIPIRKQFTLYAPSVKKEYELNEDGTLTIEGVASTTNKDLTGDVVLPEAINSMKKQLLSTSKNLHGDHRYDLFKGIIGAITEVMDSDENALKIKAIIRSKFAAEIKEMLDIGINLGLSIGGAIQDYTITKDGWEIKDISLLEISLTGMPANWDTFGTVTTSKGIVKAKCLNGACHVIRKNNINSDNMQSNITKTENNSENTLTKEDVVDLFNELMSDKQAEITRETVDQVSKELESIVKEQVDKLKEELNKSTNEEDEEVDNKDDEDNNGLKSLIDTAVKSAIKGSMDSLFKDLKENREPEFKVDKSINTEETGSKVADRKSVV